MMKAGLTAALLALALASCVSVDVAPERRDGELLSGEALFGKVVEPAPEVTPMALDEAMREFVRRHAGSSHHARMRLDGLLDGMIDEGLLNLVYDAQRTQPAVRTFHEGEGNCLSFSILFAALAREAGLDARFQRVDVPPVFASNGETVLVNNHVNILLEGVREGSRYYRNRIVDFNTAEYNGEYDMWPVRDDEILALYYGNLAVEAMAEQRWRDAFSLTKRALISDRDNADIWVNLGVIYAKQAQPELAIAAYHRALASNERSEAAMVNLATVHRSLGEDEQAAHYRDLVAHHLRRNPFYHLARARRSLEAGQVDRALEQIDRAIRLDGEQHEFFLVRALALFARGERSAGIQALERAETLARPSVAAGYSRKLTELRGG